MQITVLATVAIIVIVVVVIISRNESFADRPTKIKAISQWFETQPNPSYNAYKTTFPTSDIVEYTAVKSGKDISESLA
jgi:hypothetical protein